MFNGMISPRLEPVVNLNVIGTNGRTRRVELVLDSGFDGDLSLPSSTIQELGLQLLDNYETTLANGERAQFAGYEGQVEWHGRRRNMLVLETVSESLLGMNLLWRNRITMDVVANGPVTIEELE
ncbi:MAG: clan AA aspartic protease [Chloroflexota bacterium]|nr:clan AA aspartic protease [Chloroflexota bacterium]